MIFRALHLLVWGAVTTLAGGLVWWGCAPGVADAVALIAEGGAPTSDVTVDRLVGVVACCLVWLAYAGLVTTALLVLVAEAVPALRPLAAHVTTAQWRRLVLTACGLGISVPVSAQTAIAADLDPPPCPVSCPGSLQGLALPDLPTQQPGTRANRRAPMSEQTTVRRGDSLWLIAARQLPAGAPDRAIAVRVAALYETNRTVIGTDPDLIFPGTQLTAPEGSP